MPTPKPDRVVLIRHIDDEGTRLEIAPTMRQLTVDGVRYERAKSITFVYPDGHAATGYVACIPLAEFAPKLWAEVQAKKKSA